MGTWVQEMWNHVLQELHAMEGVEQPTCREQLPHGLFLVDGLGRSLLVDLVIMWNKGQLWLCFDIFFLSQSYLQSCVAKSSFIGDEILCKCQFKYICLWAENVKHSLYSTRSFWCLPCTRRKKKHDSSARCFEDFYLVLDAGGSGTSKSIPLRLWFLGSAYVFGIYLFYNWTIFTKMDYVQS